MYIHTYNNPATFLFKRLGKETMLGTVAKQGHPFGDVLENISLL